MVTNEERREVAEKIRKAAQHDFLGFPCFTSITVERLFNLEVKGTILGVNSYTRESAMRMADLIEPEPERTCHFEPDVIEVLLDEDGNEILDADGNEIETGEPAEDCSAFECSECGYPMIFDPDIGWFDYWSPYKPHFKYCPNCGAKVVE